MSTTFCQELQLSLDPVRSKPMTLALKIAPNSLHFSQSFTCNNIVDEENNHSKEGKESLYVHPLIKRSSETLSEKSLEMCTETLGCETGTDISGYSSLSDSYSSSYSEKENSPARERPSFGSVLKGKKSNNRSFPPPLTSASGTNSVQIRPHREGGRLVIKAIAVAQSQSYLKAERSDGRLKLSFVDDYESLDFEYEEENATLENQEDQTSHGYLEEGEMKTREIQRLRRCKEGSFRTEELLNREPFWVAA
ncbi:hypothetical protein GIB67_029067 [Kingdonia uniflora]|uniref:FAF domain-containing protein n=1 Tax=Kingdonia uniflora TaxID=39325 RepID=A0A7J7N7C1_9MAGN|nr:hypothetical protein GIB67_029067 [Kingdonia uniflora]